MIKRQQSMSVIIGDKQRFLLHELVEDILVMKSKQLSNFDIQVIPDYKVFPDLEVDRSKLLQIIENLVGNAIDALKNKNGPKKLTIQIDNENEQVIIIRIMDNGCGIEGKNLKSIFQFGFTTKGCEGHGFGLYSSIHLAKEIGGELTFASDGLDKGAVFSLKVPLQYPAHVLKPIFNP